MQFSKYNCPTISETICPQMLIFGKKASWTLFFLNIILTNPIISEISFLWHHHFSTLWPGITGYSVGIQVVYMNNLCLTWQSVFNLMWFLLTITLAFWKHLSQLYSYEITYWAACGRDNVAVSGQSYLTERSFLNLVGVGAERVGLECTNLFLSTNSTLLWEHFQCSTWPEG